MREFIIGTDITFFKLINQTLVSNWLTEFFLYLTNIHKQPTFQIIVVVFLIFCAFRSRKVTAKVFLAMVLVAGVCDLISYRILKPTFERPRPHHVRSLTKAQMRLGGRGPTSYSFPSNHALNTFALAHTVAWYFPKAKVFLYLFAILVGYSRVYLGVHFPSDIIAGAGFGIGLAALMREFVFRRINFYNK